MVWYEMFGKIDGGGRSDILISINGHGCNHKEANRNSEFMDVLVMRIGGNVSCHAWSRLLKTSCSNFHKH